MCLSHPHDHACFSLAPACASSWLCMRLVNQLPRVRGNLASLSKQSGFLTLLELDLDDTTS